MSHELESTPILEGEARSHVGTRLSKRLRAAGRLPAVIYGHKQDPISIHLDTKSTVRKIHEGERLFRVQLDGAGEPELVLLRDLQFGHLGTDIIHADFGRVDIDERVEVRVQIELVGEAVGLKTAGAILVHPLAAMELECSVFNLPESVEVPIGDLEVDGVITAGDVTLPKPTMKLLTDPDTVVAQIIVQKEEEESDEAATVGEGEAATASSEA